MIQFLHHFTVAAERFGNQVVARVWREFRLHHAAGLRQDLGEHLRLVALSVPEGDDKIAKYPVIFQRSDALVITKIDLLPHTDFDVDRVCDDMKRLATDARVFQVSARTGEGIPELADWLREQVPGTMR